MIREYTQNLLFEQLPIKKSWKRFETVDMHTGGEPLRLILQGYPNPEGNSILDYRRFYQQNYDHYRKFLMWEPRGHADMYGCLITPPENRKSDLGVLFMHNSGYSTMCGHAIIAVSRFAVDMGWVPILGNIAKVTIDAPCGTINSEVKVANGQAGKVQFQSVPSFAAELNNEVRTDSFGSIPYDLVYGGAFYACIDSDRLGIKLIPENSAQLIRAGSEIKSTILASGKKVIHPFEDDLGFLYGVIFIGSPVSDGCDTRNVCVFADGELDRCPTGSGVSGRLALHYAKGEIRTGEWMSFESIIGTVFRGRVLKESQFGKYRAVIPEVEGEAHYTGINTFLIDPDDPLKNGFFIR